MGSRDEFILTPDPQVHTTFSWTDLILWYSLPELACKNATYGTVCTDYTV